MVEPCRVVDSIWVLHALREHYVFRFLGVFRSDGLPSDSSSDFQAFDFALNYVVALMNSNHVMDLILVGKSFPLI